MPKFRHVAATVLAAGVFFLCSLDLLRQDLTSDVELLYIRRYALMSYLSMTGIEGISQSKYFVQGAQRLAKSWMRHVPVEGRGEYDMVLLVADPYSLLNAGSMALLREVGWILIKVDPVYGTPSAPSYLAQNRYTHTAQFTKLRMWTFERYEHILYIDSDMLVVRNILPTISTYQNATSKMLGVAVYRNPHEFNAGVLFITPSMAEFEEMSKVILTLTYDLLFQEQAFLQVYWHWTNRTFWMPAEMNQEVHELTEQCMVMHFVGNFKPWAICPPVEPMYEKACREWDSYQ